jgi:predicted dehydrogenase
MSIEDNAVGIERSRILYEPSSPERFDPSEPLRVVLVGAGGMGRQWLRTLAESADVELVGLVDLNFGAARAALEEAGLTGIAIGSGLGAVASATGAEAVVNVTIPAAHHPVSVEALFAGLPVLCEKPVAPTVSEALSLVAAAEASGRLLMISQSRRYYRALAALKRQAAELGDIGIVTTDFFKAPHFGGFREEMEHVLLVDMAIHAFDAARYLLDADPVSVYCEEFNPTWSWYADGAAATAVFEFAGGTRYVYTGSWCSDGQETSWNGEWRVSARGGTVTWDGERAPLVQLAPGAGGAAGTEHLGPAPVELGPESPEEIGGSLAEFVSALRTGATPSGEVHANVLSLAMVEAAVRSAESGERILIADVLADALARAIEDERRTELRSVLTSWGSPLG